MVSRITAVVRTLSASQSTLSAVFRSGRSQLKVQLQHFLFSFLQLWPFSPCNKRLKQLSARNVCTAHNCNPKNRLLSSPDLTRGDRWRKKVRLPRQLGIFCENFGDRPPVTILGYDERIVEVDVGEKSAFWCSKFICVIFRDVFLWEIPLLCVLIECLNEKTLDGQVKFQRILSPSICGNEFNQMRGLQ